MTPPEWPAADRAYQHHHTACPHNPALDYDRISPAQAQDLKELVHAVVTIITVLVAAYFFEWVRILMAVIFLVSFLHFAWTQLKG